MYRVLIVEDTPAEADALRGFLERYAAEKGLELGIEVLGSALEFIDLRRTADLVLMDIDMPGINGMEAAQIMRGYDTQTPLIFVTNLAQYAVRGYSVDALDFVVKPVEYPVFAFKFKRVLEAVCSRRRDLVNLETKDGFVRLDAADILYVEVRGHKLTYHTAHGPVEVWGTMKAATAEFEPLGFAACNACYLVNLDRVTGLSGEYVRVGEESLKMSRGKSRDFVDALTRSMGR